MGRGRGSGSAPAQPGDSSAGQPLLGEFATIFGLPDWTPDLSPFGRVPALPGGSVHAAPIVALVAIAAAVMAVGLAGLRRRDLPV